ncbi:MAG TPA: Crp/Fnr family transcriptional regulator, partial [Polyangiales bacterium]|nr:Crp/Fnr family transcriptional regulator [Polyangiales bacterium]
TLYCCMSSLSRVGFARSATCKLLRRNQLLACLSDRDLRRCSAHGATVRLDRGQVLYQPGELKHYVYFPLDSYVSQQSSLAGAPCLEVGLVGYEGMVGASLLLGVQVAPLYTAVEGAGAALRLDALQFVREAGLGSALGKITSSYIYVRMSQLGQMAACTRFHFLEARLARWLLMTRDCARSVSFRMTQNHMAKMLGVRRVGITEAAGLLQRRRLIKYHRGEITILNASRLEALSCECYITARRTYARHLTSFARLTRHT